MSRIASVLLAILLVAAGISTAANTGKDSADDEKDLYRFLLFYYQEPKPKELSTYLERIMRMEVWEERDISEEVGLAYFFGRASGKDPNIVKEYMDLFERGSHNQRLFLLRVLHLCGNEQTEKWFGDKLKAGRYINEREEIEWVLGEGIPVDINVLGEPVSDVRDLGMLNTEFGVTGDMKAIMRMIESLGFENVSIKKYEPNDPREPNAIREEAKELLKFDCRLHDKVLAICKEEMEKSKSPIKERLEEIIDETDGSISAKKWVESKPKLKLVAGEKGWALGCSAVLIERNGCRLDTLSPDEISERTVNAKRETLSKSWGIQTKEDLVESLARLENKGHRDGFEKTGRMVSEMNDVEFARLVEQNKSDKDRVGELETARKYYKQLGSKSILGWDFTRYICLCQWGYMIGLFSEEEAWEKIMPIAKRLQKTFDSWEDLGRNYIIGRQYWSREEQEKDGDLYDDALQRLLDKKSSPWNIYRWNMDLESGQDANEPNKLSESAKVERKAEDGQQ